jgi:hypothetical protein
MTAVSATVTVDNTSYETLASLADITLTATKWYSIQIQNICEWKVADAEFTFKNKEFNWKQGTDDVYIKTSGQPAIITILEQ